jgi:formate/nitrite transporter FocA (FNT family)
MFGGDLFTGNTMILAIGKSGGDAGSVNPSY